MMIYPFDPVSDGKEPQHGGSLDLYQWQDAAQSDAGRAMMRGEVAYARHWATEAAKIRDMKQTRAELDVIIAGHADRKAAREARIDAARELRGNGNEW